jgi:hypothetical protein
MNAKQLIGFIALSMGVILIIYAINGRGYIPESSSSIDAITNSPISPTQRMPENIPIVQSVGCMQLWMGIGVVLVVAGGWIAIRFRNFGA